MDHKIFAYQTADLDERIQAASQAVAEKFGIPGLGNTWSRDEMTRKLNEQTALAAFLETLATQDVGVSLTSILAIDGLSKTSAKVIKAHFGVSDGDSE